MLGSVSVAPGTADHRSLRARFSRVVALLTAFAVAMLGVVVVAPAAQAAGTPDVALTVASPGQALQGAPFDVTLTASNSTATDAYNTSFRMVLPVGVTLESSAPADVAPILYPQADGSTVVVWTNVTDLLAGTTSAVTATVSPGTLPLGDVTFTGGAYVNTNPRIVPTFTGTSATPGDATGSDTGTSVTELVPFTITKTTVTPVGEAELLRGVHDHRTSVSLTIDNNFIADSNSFSIVDYIPANLEFLGCGSAADDADNSSALEYTGADALNASTFAVPGDCPAPSSVDTQLVDPDGAGPLTEDVYTVVTWDTASLATVGAGALTAGGSHTIHYVIGAPQNANALFADPAPSATGLTQGSNLDNNTGPSTLETGTEQAPENVVTLDGTYTGTGAGVYSDSDSSIVTLEDLAIQKTASRDSIVQGTTTTWTLTVETSEYTGTASALVVTDHVPDGLEVTGTAVGAGAGFPATSIDIEADGTTTVVWSGADMPDLATNGTRTLTITTDALIAYRSTGLPVLANDSWTNTVTLEGTATEVIDGVVQAPRAVADESSAAQSAGPITLVKEVAAPLNGVCDDGTALGPWEDVSSTDFTPGDVVCWRISFATPENLDSNGVVLTDFLPAGYTYVSSTSPASSYIDFDANQPTQPEPGAGVLNWTFGGAGADLDQGAIATVVVTTKITDAGAAEDGSILGNLAKLSYKNTDGQTFQLRTKAEAPWVEPILGLTKTAAAVAPATDTGALNGGDSVDYTVTVTNTGGIAADHVAVRDVLPSQLSCDDVVSISPAGFTCPTGTGVISGEIATVAGGGGTSTLTYRVLVPTTLTPGTALQNVAHVDGYDVATNDPADPTFPYTSTLEAPRTVRVDTVTMQKSSVSSVDEVGNTLNGFDEATAGEEITYTVTTTLPAGTTVTNGRIADTLPASLAVVAGSVAITTDTTTSGGSAIALSGNTVTVLLPGSPAPYTVGAVDETVVFTVRATVLSTSTLTFGNTVQNLARLTADGMTDVVARTTTRIVEPNVKIAKADADGDAIATPGETIPFTLTVTNPDSSTLYTSAAKDVEVVDTLPTSMNPLDAAGVVLTADGTVGTVVNGAGIQAVGAWDEGNRTITWNGTTVAALASVAPNATVSLAYRVQVADPVPAPTSFTNNVTVVASSLAGPAGDERTGTPGDEDRYADTASDTLDGPSPYVVKSVLPGDATVGQEVTYTVVASIPPSVTTYDATVLDTLPTGMAFVPGSTTSACAPIAACGGLTASEITPSGQSLGWFLGDLPAMTDQRDVTITYRAVVTDIAGNVAGTTRVNSATIGSNATDKVGPGGPVAVPAPGDFDGVSGPSTATVTVVEPHVTLVKEVDEDGTWVESRHIVSGETVTYRVTVANDGTSAANNVVVTDDFDARMTGFALAAGQDAVVTATSGIGSATFTLLNPLAVDDSVTITYTLTAPALGPGDEVVGFELVNTADATYSSLPGTPTGERQYDDVVEDTVGLEADLGVLGDTVWFDLDGNTTQTGPEFGVSGIPVTVTGPGPNGTLGDGDDVVVFDDVTDADGTYLVTGLDEGDYSVVLGTLPAGTGVVFDDDDQRVSPDGATTVTLTEAAPEYLDADFAIAGSGTVGDLVWLDSDGDGAQATDGSEPGLAGIGVTVVWHGPDGDVTYTTTTGTDGSWSVPNVPAGDLTVTLDPTTFPEGLAPVSERDATVDGSVDLAFDGTADPDYDFGLRGPGTLGDLVWLDVDSDGTQATDGTEPGIAGATVQVIWTAPNGGTNAVFTATTGPDGEYGLENLPLGDYTVSVTLPVALAPTYDLDGGTASPNGTTDVTLTAARPDEPNADFGYVAATGVGDTVFLDLDGNGAEDPGEPGIPGVEVTVTSGGPDGLLSTTGDNLVVETTTDADGYYQVLGLPVGETLVEITGGLPGGLTQTYDADGIGTLGSSQTDLALVVFDDAQDFGYVGANSIGDTVWVDVDANGVQDAGEPGLPGVTVGVLWLGQDGVEGGDDDILFLTVTDEDGMYLVDGLPNGNYEVAIVSGVPDGYTESYDETDALDGFSVVDGLGADGPEDHLTADFGYAGTGALGGTIWLDRDVDGELDTPTEAGLPGIVVDVTWAGPDGVLGTDDDVVITTETGEGGTWVVENMPPGPFTAVVDPTTIPEGTEVVWDRTNGTAGPDGVFVGDLAPGAVITDIDTAVKGTGSIGDLVWIDSDKDGIRDPNEPAATNVRVVVIWLGVDGVLGGGDDVTIEVRTDADGIYVADGLPAGNYVVTFDKSTFPKGTAAFADLDGGDPLVTSVSLTTGQVRTDVDLVLRPSALASTGATVGGILALVLLLLGGGAFLRRRASALATQVE